MSVRHDEGIRALDILLEEVPSAGTASVLSRLNERQAPPARPIAYNLPDAQFLKAGFIPSMSYAIGGGTLTTSVGLITESEWEPLNKDDERLLRSMLREQRVDLGADIDRLERQGAGVAAKLDDVSKEFNGFQLLMTRDFMELKTEVHTTAKILWAIFGALVIGFIAQIIVSAL